MTVPPNDGDVEARHCSPLHSQCVTVVRRSPSDREAYENVSSRAFSYMIRRWSSIEKLVDVVEEVLRLREPLAVRPVGAEQDALDRQVPGQLVDALLDERRDPAVLDELVLRVARVVAAVAQVLERLQQRRHPGGAVLDVGHLQAREPLEQAGARRGCTEKSWTMRFFMSDATTDPPPMHAHVVARSAWAPRLRRVAPGTRQERAHLGVGGVGTVVRASPRRPTPARDPRTRRTSGRPVSAARRA